MGAYGQTPTCAGLWVPRLEGLILADIWIRKHDVIVSSGGQTGGMSLRPLASMLVKVLGLYTVVQSLNALELVWHPLLTLMDGGVPLFRGYLEIMPSWLDVIPGLLVGTAQIVIGGVLWRTSDNIGRAIVKVDEPIGLASEADWRRIGFGMVGAYLLADSATRLALLYSLSKSASGSHDERLFVFSTLVRGVIGVWLLLGTRQIVRGMMNLKDVGRDAELESRP